MRFTKQQLTLINDIVKPWDELNEFLAHPFAVQPEMSDLTRRGGEVAKNLCHFPENTGLGKRRQGGDFDVVNDLADSLKHGSLRESRRQATLHAVSMFEWKDDKFKFLRNALVVTHASLGTFDLMELLSRSIAVWCGELGVIFTGVIALKSGEFFSEARLQFDPRFCVSMDQSRIQIVKRDQAGALVPFSPPEVRFAVY